MAQVNVSFARINRRADEQQDMSAQRPFAEEMGSLVSIRQTRSSERGSRREWIAADMQIVQGDTFLIGTIGFREPHDRLDFEEDTYSWVKAERHTETGASERDVVPFAIDLREDRRWIAHAVRGAIRPAVFRNGLRRALTAAIAAEGTIPGDWEVDPITSIDTVEEWIRHNPDVREFIRKVKRHNPHRSIDDDIEDMEALGAQQKTETYTAGRGTLRVENKDGELTEKLSELLEGIETGRLEVGFTSRTPGGQTRFRSWRQQDSVTVDDYGSDLEYGMELVLSALRRYSAQRADESGSLPFGNGDTSEEE